MNKNLSTSTTEYSNIDSNIKIYSYTHYTRKLYVIYFKLKTCAFADSTGLFETYAYDDSIGLFDVGLVLINGADERKSPHYYHLFKFGNIRYFPTSSSTTL